MARAHEEARLREPSNRAAEVRAVHRKHLELLAFDAPHPARGVRRLAVGRRHERIAERRQPRFAFRELADATERHPRGVGVLPTAA